METERRRAGEPSTSSILSCPQAYASSMHAKRAKNPRLRPIPNYFFWKTLT